MSLLSPNNNALLTYLLADKMTWCTFIKSIMLLENVFIYYLALLSHLNSQSLHISVVPLEYAVKGNALAVTQ
jgi:hypothetical protein